MTLNHIERDIRLLSDVIACQVTGSEVIVLVKPGADPQVVRAAAEHILLGAADAQRLRVIGGTPAVTGVPAHRIRVAVAATAGAAALTAAAVAAAVTGVFHADVHTAPRPVAAPQGRTSGQSAAGGSQGSGRVQSPTVPSSSPAPTVEPAAPAPQLLAIPLPHPLPVLAVEETAEVPPPAPTSPGRTPVPSIPPPAGPGTPRQPSVPVTQPVTPSVASPSPVADDEGDRRGSHGRGHQGEQGEGNHGEGNSGPHRGGAPGHHAGHT